MSAAEEESQGGHESGGAGGPGAPLPIASLEVKNNYVSMQVCCR